MLIKNFIETYSSCPLCHERLEIQAVPQSTSSDHAISVIIVGNDRLKINVQSEFFVNPKRRSFDFTIAVSDGQIISCDQTNQFVSLYDLGILLKKECINCAKRTPGEIFTRSILVHYDRSESKFVSEPYYEEFGIVSDDKFYFFCNNFGMKSSYLSVQPMRSKNRNSNLYTPFIPFDKFNFNDRGMLMHKLNALQLLR